MLHIAQISLYFILFSINATPGTTFKRHTARRLLPTAVENSGGKCLFLNKVDSILLLFFNI